MAGDTLESDLQRTDILELLDGDFLAGVPFLVEVDRLHDAGDDGIRQEDDDDGEYKPGEYLFQSFVHYRVFFIFQLSDKVNKTIY